MTHPRLIRSTRQSSGFTLLEVLVALAILSVTGGAIYEALSYSLKRSGDLREKELALLTAQSLLEQLRADNQFSSSGMSGTTPQGLTWRILLTPHPIEGIDSARVKPFDVQISVQRQKKSRSNTVVQSVELLTVPES